MKDERLSLAREKCAEMGSELTPEQYRAELAGACESIREAMAAKGHTVPDSDEELLDMMYAALAMKGSTADGPAPKRSS